MQLTVITGNLTADPERRATPAGKELASFTVAVNEKHGDKDEATFYSCTAWERKADPICQYLHKGDKVCVTGKVKARAFKGKDGEPRASLEMTVDSCEFLVVKRQQDAPKEEAFTKVENDPDLPF